MENIIPQRLEALRSRMEEQGIDAYLVPTDDFHSSEYVGDYFKCRKFITGFTGSAGTAVITKDMAGLWTDGRYFIQAAKQLEGTTVTLFKMGVPGVPTVQEFLAQTLQEGQCLGFDGRTVGAREAEQIAEKLADKHVTLKGNVDLVGDIWTDRPALSCVPVMELDVKWCGKSRARKLQELRDTMAEKKADVFLLTSLDDIAWLLNIRGGDVECNPVVLSYLAVTGSEALLFANEKAFPEDVIRALAADGVRLCPYNDIYSYGASLTPGQTVLLSREKVNSRLVNSIPDTVKILDEENPTLLPKAVKNPVEVENTRRAHLKDGVAVTKFMYWLKKNIGKTPMTEISAGDYLHGLRQEQENFQGDSFEAIVAYGEHAAICHYSATPETDVEVEPHGFLLVDSGGQYLEGTTDITRTFVMGPTTEEERRYFTAVLRGHLNLADARFLYGCRGVNLDYLARSPLWEMGADYNHGTGHGVGYFLNVHEGPNGFRWKIVPERNDSAVFEEGMITSNEPGYYAEGKFGIRHETLMVCKKGPSTEYGQFMEFEELTLVPYDLEAVVPEQMTEKERRLLNEYHALVYEKISPYLDPEEREWLKTATRAI